LDATSSRRLKEQNKRPKKQKKRENAKTRLARAAANAAALYPKQPFLETQQQPALGSLQQLTHAIDAQLLQNKANNFSRMMQPQDSMSSLLDFNTEHENNPSYYTVALVFGKALQQDQVTAEYAARIRALVQYMMEENLHVDALCFCGPKTGDNHLATADAGYTFFRHLCASHNVDLSAVNIIMDRTSKDEAAVLVHLAKHLQAYYIADWLKEAALEETAPANDKYSLARNLRKKIHVHLELISTGYHLCNLNDIHHRSPGQSFLRPVELMRREYSSFAQYEVWDDDDDDEIAEERGGIVETSWSYRYATYPYLYAKEDAVAFMARCYLLGQELMPLFINLKGVVQEKEFFQRDNYLVLASIRRSLVSQMEELYKTKPTLRNDLRTPGRDVNVALEGVVLSLGRCIDLVRPAGLLVGSVSKTDYERALRSLEHAVSQIQSVCDPDEPLDPSEWGKLSGTSSITGEMNETVYEKQYTQLDAKAWEEYETSSMDGDVIDNYEQIE
jgi:hypothetical protein